MLVLIAGKSVLVMMLWMFCVSFNFLFFDS